MGRSSNIELLRIVSQYIIIIYHIFVFCVLPLYPDITIYRGVMIPFHIGVGVFVLISGYFGIKPTTKGIVKLLGISVVYIVPITLAYFFIRGGKSNLKDLLVISNSQYWFIRTYFCLYLFSPILNAYLEKADKRQLTYAFVVLFFIAIYIGTATIVDKSLSDGKNLACFSLFYISGHIISKYKDFWLKHRCIVYFFAFLGLNILVVGVYILAQSFHIPYLPKALMHISFPYCSPILLISSILLFMTFAKIHLQSKWINYFAKSSFAIYLIHLSNVGGFIMHNGMDWICNLVNGNILLVILGVFTYAIIILLLCIAIDKLLTPIWRGLDKVAVSLSNKFTLYKA